MSGGARSGGTSRRSPWKGAARASSVPPCDPLDLQFGRYVVLRRDNGRHRCRAGVALKTVNVAFETKSGLLRALSNLLLCGDEGETPVAERSWYREVVEEPDPQR
jgi:hypothetical protein